MRCYLGPLAAQWMTFRTHNSWALSLARISVFQVERRVTFHHCSAGILLLFLSNIFHFLIVFIIFSWCKEASRTVDEVRIFTGSYSLLCPWNLDTSMASRKKVKNLSRFFALYIQCQMSISLLAQQLSWLRKNNRVVILLIGSEYFAFWVAVQLSHHKRSAQVMAWRKLLLQKQWWSACVTLVLSIQSVFTPMCVVSVVPCNR